MKIEIDIPDDELRTCFSCSSGEMNLTLSVNETIDGYDITDIVSDVYAGNASLNFRKVEKAPKVYTAAGIGDLRERLVNAIVEVFGDSEKFLDYIENEEYPQSFYDVFYSGSGECYIINRSTGEYINWYKFTHIGRDIHSTVTPDDFVKFLSDFGLLKGE